MNEAQERLIRESHARITRFVEKIEGGIIIERDFTGSEALQGLIIETKNLLIRIGNTYGASWIVAEKHVELKLEQMNNIGKIQSDDILEALYEAILLAENLSKILLNTERREMIKKQNI